MKVLQINAVYAKSSTGRTTREMHEYFLEHGVDSYVAAPDLAGLSYNCYRIGNNVDHKIHAFLNRITGKQAYYSYIATRKMLKWVDIISPDVIILRNLHSNYINLPVLIEYVEKNNISTVLVLHDSWFMTGGCTYYIAPNCYKWKNSCGHCPALARDICSWGIDKTSFVLRDRKRMFGRIKRLSVVGVSQWVTDDAKKSVLEGAFSIQCIYNWIDLKTFYPRNRSEIKNKYGIDPSIFVILGVSASWSKEKGIDVFHELASMLTDNQRIILVGNSESLDYKHPQIKYVPAINDIEKLAEVYSMADVFINPTVQETFGKTTAESLSCGTPVVAFNGTATPELIGTDGKCGYLVNTNIASDYYKYISLINQNGSHSYLFNCRNRAQKLFDKEANIKKYLDLFRTMQNIGT